MVWTALLVMVVMTAEPVVVLVATAVFMVVLGVTSRATVLKFERLKAELMVARLLS